MNLMTNLSAKTTVLSHDDLKLYPSIMAASPAGRTSTKYSFIPTTRIIEQFEAGGFYPVHVKEAHAGEDRFGYQKHLIRFRQPNVEAMGVEGLFPEIVLVNSHDAGTSFRLMMGIFRMICTNGMVVGESFGGTIRINHIGYTDQVVRESIRTMEERLPRIMDRVDEFKSLEMTPDDKGVFALAAMAGKYGHQELIRRTFDQEALMRPNRAFDTASTLWNSYNTVQEKLVEKGSRIELRKTKERYNYRTKTMQPVIKHVRTRAVNSPTENVRMNQMLWTLAEGMGDRLKNGRHAKEGEAAEIMKKICIQETGQETIEGARAVLVLNV